MRAARPPTFGDDTGKVHVRPETDNIVAISLEGEFDRANSFLISEQAEQALDEDKHLILDLSEATFIDSSTIHALVQAQNAAAKHGQIIVLQLGTAATVERALQLSGIDQLLPRAGTRGEAVQTLQRLAQSS
jgi:anti-sigma B factor antagonist